MITSQIDQDLITAMKSQNTLEVSVLRMVKSALKNIAIEKNKELDESEAIQVLRKEIKKRNESIELYQQTNRLDLAENESQEKSIIEKYVPAEMSSDQINQIIDEVIAQIGSNSLSDFGKIMPEVMKKTNGNASGGEVSKLVKEKLS